MIRKETQPNPFSGTNADETDADTAREHPLEVSTQIKPVLLIAHSPVDSYEMIEHCEDRFEIAQDLTIGRKLPADIALDDSWLSKAHFKIHRENQSFFVEDLGSTNGTFLNGKALCPNEGYRLANSSLIRAGRTLFVFHEDGGVLLDPIPDETFGIAGRFHVTPLLNELKRLANAYTHLLLAGPTGSGKELAAHAFAHFSGKKLIIHNAARFSTDSEALSTLYGMAPAVFTGVAEHIGLIESADKKILFLDEAHMLSRHVQKSLLRVLEYLDLQPCGRDLHSSRGCSPHTGIQRTRAVTWN